MPEVAPRLLVEVGGAAETVGSSASGFTGPFPQTLETSEMRDSSSVTALEVTPLVVAWVQFWADGRLWDGCPVSLGR